MAAVEEPVVVDARHIARLQPEPRPGVPGGRDRGRPVLDERPLRRLVRAHDRREVRVVTHLRAPRGCGAQDRRVRVLGEVRLGVVDVDGAAELDHLGIGRVALQDVEHGDAVDEERLAAGGRRAGAEQEQPVGRVVAEGEPVVVCGHRE